MSDQAAKRDVVVSRFVLVSCLTLFDAAATLLIVGVLGGAELNPLIGAAVERVGIAAAMGLRAAVGVAGAGLMAVFASHPANRWGSRPLAWAAMVLAVLACWHVAQVATHVTTHMM